MTITLYVGRHGETELNSEHKLRGWLDVPLNEAGIRESEAMSRAMLATDLNRVYTSDLDRAEQTAQIVAKPHRLEPIARDWFRPLDYGELAGKPLSEIKPVLDQLNHIWKTDPYYKAPGGESFADFQDRNLQGLHAILQNAQTGESILLIAHLRNCRLFHGIAVNQSPLEGEAVQLMHTEKWHQSSGSVSKFEYAAEQDSGLLHYTGMYFQTKADEESPVPKEGLSILSETAVEDKAMLGSSTRGY